MPKGIPSSGTRKPGAGPKKGNKPETTTIAFRVPVIFKARLELAMRNMISEMKKQEPLN